MRSLKLRLKASTLLIHPSSIFKLSHSIYRVRPLYLFSAFFIFIILVFASLLLFPLTRPVLAGPTPGNPISISATIDHPSLNLQFSQSELASSVFKQVPVTTTVTTNNPTGFTFYVSSIDEDTNLNHSDSAITEKIASISSPLTSSAFAAKSWGYSLDGTNFNPIPKASTPAEILRTTAANTTPNNLSVNFGVKASPDLYSGTYSKQILFTAVTNRIPTAAVFLPGPEFNAHLADLNHRKESKGFKKAASLNVNPADAILVSAADSERPIYMWQDAADNLIYWWSDADVVYANENAKSMFATPASLGSANTLMDFVDVSDINMSRVKDMSYMFYGGKYKTIKEKILGDFDTSNVEDMSHMFENSIDSDSTTQIPINFSRFNTSKVKNMSYMFKMSRLPSIDLRGLDTSNVTNMEYMFYGMLRTTSVNLANLDVRKVSNMNNIFSYSGSLQTLDVSNWKNDSITNMNNMFSGLASLTSLNIQGFTTNHVTSMSYMFGYSKSLPSLDLSSFDTSNVDNIQGMFHGMNSLTYLNVSSFNTNKITSLFYTFSDLFSLEELDLSSFDTSNVIDMQHSFENLKRMRNLNLSSFDTRKVTNMFRMFLNLMSEAENGILDLSSFDTRSLASTMDMFANSKVKTIYASPSFVTNHVSLSANQFFACTNLVGGNGTTYSPSNPTDKTYARIDAPGNPGYFTLKP